MQENGTWKFHRGPVENFEKRSSDAKRSRKKLSSSQKKIKRSSDAKIYSN
jgi:hypothetical protein